jgi:hypothetical protein
VEPAEWTSGDEIGCWLGHADCILHLHM